MGPDQVQAVLALLADVSAKIAELQPMLVAMLPPTERQPLRVVQGGKADSAGPDQPLTEADALFNMFHGVR